MASVEVGRLGTNNAVVKAIRIREQSESSSTNRYRSGSIPGVLSFESIPDSSNKTYVLEVDFENCASVSKTFTLNEPCKASPSVVPVDDCNTTSGTNATLKLTVSLQNSPTVRVRVLNGTTVLRNEVVNSGSTVSYLLPVGTPLRIITEHPTSGNCKNEITHTITCNCSFTISTSNAKVETGTGPEPEPQVGYFSAATFNAQNLAPWTLYGVYNNTYKPGASIVDYIGGFRKAPYRYDNPSQRLSNLGLQKVGIYLRGDYSDQGVEYGDNSQYLAREPRDNRYLYLGQGSYERTNPPMAQHFVDPYPSIDGAPYTFDSGETWQPEISDQITYRDWNIVRAWYTRATPDSSGNSWGIVRFNVEGHVHTGDFNWFRRCRNIWGGGMYRHSRNGGDNTNKFTGESKLPEEPNYAQMSDAEWILHVRQCQVNYSQWVYGKSQAEGADVIGYDLESQAGFIQELPSPGSMWNDTRGYRRDPNWKRPSQLTGKTLRETLVASNAGLLDTLFKAAPFQLVYTDVNREEQWNQQWPMASLGIAENTTPTQIYTNGDPEFYRFTVNRNDSSCATRSSVTIRFEDKDGNLRRTTRKMDTESATDDYRLIGGTSSSHSIPIGTAQFKYCHHVALGERWVTNTLDFFSDEQLIKVWEFANYNYIADDKKPFQYQVYAKTLNDRHFNTTNEVTDSGQLPRNLVFGFKFLGYTFNIMHVWYNAFTYTGALTMDNVFAAEKVLNKYQNHFVEGQVEWKPVEVSMDGGLTWTSANPIVKRTDIVSGESEAFFANDPNGYNSTWVTTRRNQGKASPFIFLTYNNTTKSYVYFSKCAFGDIITYSFRVKEGSTYRYFNDQVSTNQWKDTRLNLTV